MKKLVVLPEAFNNAKVKSDTADRLSLTDIWKAAGRPKDNRPIDWLNLPTANGFVAAVAKCEKVEKSHLLETSRGRTGGTFGHRQIALEYAQYLNPDLAVAVNQLFFDRVAEEKNPDLIIDRAVRTYERRGYSPEYIATRLNGKATRLILTSTLRQHGVSTSEGFRQCTNATYFPLFGGGTTVIRNKYKIPAKSSVRDNLPLLVLRGIEFAEALAADGIEKKGLYGVDACVSECNRSAQLVGEMVNKHRGVATL